MFMYVVDELDEESNEGRCNSHDDTQDTLDDRVKMKGDISSGWSGSGEARTGYLRQHSEMVTFGVF